MKVGDVVKDPTGYHKGIGIIISIETDTIGPDASLLCIYWPTEDYNTGCRDCHVELINEDR